MRNKTISDVCSWVLITVVHHVLGVRAPPTPIVMVMVMVMFFCSAVGLPTPSVTEGGRSHSDGIKHARVEPSAPSAPTNQGRGYHRQLSCALQSAQDFSPKIRARAQHKPKKLSFQSSAHHLFRKLFCEEARQSGCSCQHASSKIHITASDQMRSSTYAIQATKQVLQ